MSAIQMRTQTVRTRKSWQVESRTKYLGRKCSPSVTENRVLNAGKAKERRILGTCVEREAAQPESQLADHTFKSSLYTPLQRLVPCRARTRRRRGRVCEAHNGLWSCGKRASSRAVLRLCPSEK